MSAEEVKTGIVKWSKAGKTLKRALNGELVVYDSVPEYAVRDVVENGCTMPRPKRIEYSMRPSRDGKPAVLATVVFFDDGTKSIVKNCPEDPVDVETKTLSDGTVVQLASHESKERGLVYAILKRMLSSLDEDGNAVCSGLGNSLRELVASAVDQNLVAAEKKVAKQKLAEEEAKPAKPKPPKKAKPEADLAKLASALSSLYDLVASLEAEKEEDPEASVGC